MTPKSILSAVSFFAIICIALASESIADAIMGTATYSEPQETSQITQDVKVYSEAVNTATTVTETEIQPVPDYSWIPLNLDVPLDYVLQYDLWSACVEFGVDYPLMLALIERETNFQNIDGDGGNSIGYCQIQPRWWSWLMQDIGASDLTNPKDNFRTSCAIMSYLVEKFGTVQDALSAYNTGKPGETEYAREILAERDVWREIVEIN